MRFVDVTTHAEFEVRLADLKRELDENPPLIMTYYQHAPNKTEDTQI